MAKKIEIPLPERYIDEIHLKPLLSDEDMEIYFNVMKRVNPYQNLTLEKAIVELEKENKVYRYIIAHLNKNDNRDQDISGKDLYDFLFKYIPTGEVLNLYKLLKETFDLK